MCGDGTFSWDESTCTHKMWSFCQFICAQKHPILNAEAPATQTRCTKPHITRTMLIRNSAGIPEAPSHRTNAQASDSREVLQHVLHAEPPRAAPAAIRKHTSLKPVNVITMRDPDALFDLSPVPRRPGRRHRTCRARLRLSTSVA